MSFRQHFNFIVCLLLLWAAIDIGIVFILMWAVFSASSSCAQSR